MKQRIGIAQALLNDPRVLIVDEPTVGLDPEQRIAFRNLLTSWRETAIVILSTHIVSDVEATATDLAIVHHGRLLRHAPRKRSWPRPPAASGSDRASADLAAARPAPADQQHDPAAGRSATAGDCRPPLRTPRPAPHIPTLETPTGRDRGRERRRSPIDGGIVNTPRVVYHLARADSSSASALQLPGGPGLC